MYIIPLTEMSAISPTFITPAKTVAEEKKDNTISFGDILKTKIQNVKDLETQSLQSAYDISTGASNDIDAAMMSATKASTAIEMTVQLTTRAVNAYKDILNIQV